ncbi:uncharacterized protein LOC134290605 [Aedes albopictus]|uniref:Peptidase aspartic putative domain-containing protein n=1 Tax=Aedes albopictus TaxID=7160 RepID=A0ABM1ZQX3_AEDAL
MQLNNQKQQTATTNPAEEKPVSTTQLQDSSTNEVVACSGGLAANSKRFPASSITILPTALLDEAQLRNLQKLNLADPVYNKASPIDVILGADVFLSVLRDGQIRDQFKQPVAQNSVFGWIISGKHNDSDDNDAAFSLCSEIDIDKTLRMFWESEELQKAKQFTPEEQLVMEHCEKTYSRDGSGRFIVRLPFNNKKHEIGEIYTAAVRRLHAMERRFKTDPEFEECYKAFMKDYASLGHMERIPDSEVDVGSNCYYLPHHAVTKEDSLSTKLRVVFYGSCPSTTGISLNQTLYVGPNINPDLLVVLSRFRTSLM